MWYYDGLNKLDVSPRTQISEKEGAFIYSDLTIEIKGFCGISELVENLSWNPSSGCAVLVNCFWLQKWEIIRSIWKYNIYGSHWKFMPENGKLT